MQTAGWQANGPLAVADRQILLIGGHATPPRHAATPPRMLARALSARARAVPCPLAAEKKGGPQNSIRMETAGWQANGPLAGTSFCTVRSIHWRWPAGEQVFF